MDQNFSRQDYFREHVSDLTNWESLKIQFRWPFRAWDVRNNATRYGPEYLRFCGSASEKTCKHNEERSSYQFADGGWDNFKLRKANKIVNCKHSLSKCSNILQTGQQERRKGEREEGLHLKSNTGIWLFSWLCFLSYNHICLIFAMKIIYRRRYK